MAIKNKDESTEWIFCKGLKGKCSGLNPNSKVIETIPKTIIVHGKEIQGWMVKIVQEQAEGHLNLDLNNRSDE